MAYYKDCGWMPFGWNQTKAINVGMCDTGTTLIDNKCVVSIDACDTGTTLIDNKCVLPGYAYNGQQITPDNT